MRPVGKTAAISVTNSSSTAITVGSDTSDFANKVALLNTGSTVIAMQFGAVGKCPAAVLATGGSPSPANIVLPASMIAPIVVCVPAFPCDVTAIGSAAGPSLVYVTPVEA